MAARHDYTKELLIRYDEIVKAVRQAAKENNVDLSKIVIRMKETEDRPRKYVFYN